MTPQTRRRLLLLSPVALAVLVVAFLVFRPDTLFVDDVVDEQLDAGLAAALDATASPTSQPTASSAPTESDTPTPSRDGPTGAPTPTTAPTPTPEETPGPPVDAGPRVLARGEWVSLEHTTTGSVAIVDDGGERQLVLRNLDTSNGPDLRVILSPKAAQPGDWFGYEADATYLGGLKGNQGTQTYDIPDDLDLDQFASVVIWCDRFSVGFGAADLA